MTSGKAQGKVGLFRRENTSRIHLETFLREAAASLPDGARVLDAGAGTCRYKPLFDRALYESADFCKVERAWSDISFVCDLASIPVADSCYDMVVCTQVLEHVPDPAAVLCELHRILKPGGELRMTLPFYYAEHLPPYDYYRFTRFGIEHLLGNTGFADWKIDWLEGYFGTLSYQLETAGRALPLERGVYGKGALGFIALPPVFVMKKCFALAARFFSILDLRNKVTSFGHCKNYAVTAVKKAN